MTNLIIRVSKTYMGVTSRNFWIYLYISVRLPSWAMHASHNGAGASSNFLALARLAKNGNKAFPKCFVDCTPEHELSPLLNDAIQMCPYVVLLKTTCKEMKVKGAVSHTSLGSSVGRQSIAMSSIPSPSRSVCVLSSSGLYLKDEKKPGKYTNSEQFQLQVCARIS